MNRVEQTNPYSCFAAVAAMIAETSIEEVFEAIGHDGTEEDSDSIMPDGLRPILITEIFRFLLSKGFVIGAFFKKETHDDNKILSVSSSINDPAMLIVHGQKYLHAVLWTGTGVLDPSRGADDLYDLEDYRIYQWWPVTVISRE